MYGPYVLEITTSIDMNHDDIYLLFSNLLVSLLIYYINDVHSPMFIVHVITSVINFK